MKTEIKFIKKWPKGYKIGKSYYSEKNMKIAIMESNIILSSINKQNDNI